MAVREDPRGWVVLELPGGPVRLRFGFSELADADEYLGRALLGAMAADALNFHLIRVAFYFASRKLNKGIRSVKGAGQLLEGAKLTEVSEAISEAMRIGGITEEETADDGELEEAEPGEE